MEKVKIYLQKRMQSLKKIAFFIILVFLYNTLYSQNFEVVKIDSTKKHYIITIKGENDFLGKIVTEKKKKSRKFKSFPLITEGNLYELNLDDYMLFKFLNKTSYKTETGGKGNYEIDGVEIWNVNDNFSIYESKDLKGLYYIRERIKNDGSE